LSIDWLRDIYSAAIEFVVNVN